MNSVAFSGVVGAHVSISRDSSVKHCVCVGKRA
jgi:hypothetical protein